MQKHVWLEPKKPAYANGSKTDTNNTSFTTHAETYVLQEDDMISLQSYRTENTFSSTDGVDVVGDPPPDTFVEWHANWTGRIILNRRFKQTIIVLLVLNSITMGVETFDFVTENKHMYGLFYLLDTVFLLLFSVEICLRIVHEHRSCFGQDPWLLFDTIIIATSWLCITLLAIRTFRVLRTLRLATRLKPLRDVVLVIGRVFKRVGAIILMLFLSLYVYSIVFTDLFKGTQQEFRRLDITSWTLIQIMTLDGWSDIAKESMDGMDWVWTIYLMFIVTSFVLISLIVAVLVEALINLDTEQIEKKLLVPPAASNLDSPTHSQHAMNLARLEAKLDAMSQAVDLLTRNQIMLQAALIGHGGMTKLPLQRDRSNDGSTIESDDSLDAHAKYIVHL